MCVPKNIKRQLLFIVLLKISLVNACIAQTDSAYLFTGFHEPANKGLRLLYSYDGYHWEDLDSIFLTPKVGSQRVMRDPSIIRSKDGTYHLVWTSSWRDDKGFGYASSKDLIHWSEQRMIPVMKNATGVKNVWAPEFFYDDEKDRFIIMWSSTVPGKFDDTHRVYYTITKDFDHFSPAKLLYDPGFNSIDAELVKMKQGKYALVIKNNVKAESKLFVAFSESPLGPFHDPTPYFTPIFSEGPTTIKVGDEWLIYFDVYRQKIFGAVKTKDFKHFEDITQQIAVPLHHKHGTIIKVPKAEIERLKNALNQ